MPGARRLSGWIATTLIAGLAAPVAAPALAAGGPTGTLVVAHEEGLWAMGLPGRTLRALPGTDEAVDEEPALSPAGDQLAFTRTSIGLGPARIMVRALPSGAARQVAVGRTPAFAPSGAEVAYEGEGGIRAVDVVTGAGRELTAGTADRDPAWAAGGGVAFARGARGADGVLTIPAAGGVPRRAVWSVRRGVGVVRPAWSPDGRRLAVAVVDARTEEARRPRPAGWCARSTSSLRTAPGISLAFVACGGRVAWSPDGRSAAVRSPRGLAFLTSRGRRLGTICDTGSVGVTGLAWGGAPVAAAAAGRETDRPFRCETPATRRTTPRRPGAMRDGPQHYARPQRQVCFRKRGKWVCVTY